MTFYELVSGFAARNAVEGLVADGGGAVFSIDGTEVALREDAALRALPGTVSLSALREMAAPILRQHGGVGFASFDELSRTIRAHALVDWALGHSHDHLEAWP